MRRLFVAGNWKMNLLGASAKQLAEGVAAAVPADESAIDALVCPPYPYLRAVGGAVDGSGVQLGAQDVYHEPEGAFTGEVSADMLADVGCGWVILGHSERRHVIGETDELINKKVAAALKAGLKVMLCVGELLSDREANQTEAVVDAQLTGSLKGVSDADMANVAVAYEPVWAIGTGVTASKEQAESAHAHVRKWLAGRYNSEVAEATRILYGGSVKPDNAAELMSQPNIDGVLVGGASLKTDLFVPIIEAAQQVAAS
ncbi:Triosephosphate isomerase [Symmachiella macrocystis]|uniref:Triosephosphate isomerase n=1 Tax=Symmachiella macrocystis TaxID=2527985 RepID=A0A5C6BRM0_9PLAN|nr:triose-phosphate isomerase [Symmachiella macrocystis]TWU14407.1 Triosephosphate isomerase [Symmachiella macrocystis]